MNKENTNVPTVTFKIRTESELGIANACEIRPCIWEDLTTDVIFKDKKVVVFSLPGAFTPICTTYQLPEFEEKAQEFYDKGVDDIYCCSVNDSFVMNAWRAVLNIKHVKVLPDGNGTFTEGMGQLVDMSDVGFGKRSTRYAMIVDNGIVTKMFIEPDASDGLVAGDPYFISGETKPENVLKSL